MFSLGNGIWVAPEFIASVSIHCETYEDNRWEWVEVGLQDSKYHWTLNMTDQKITHPHTDGLKTLGYASPEAFCAELLQAIRDAKQ